MLLRRECLDSLARVLSLSRDISQIVRSWFELGLRRRLPPILAILDALHSATIHNGRKRSIIVACIDPVRVMSTVAAKVH